MTPVLIGAQSRHRKVPWQKTISMPVGLKIARISLVQTLADFVKGFADASGIGAGAANVYWAVWTHE